MSIFQRAKLWWGISLLGLALLCRLIFVLFPSGYEWFYFERFFPYLRHIQGVFYPLWLIPGYTLLVCLILIWIIIYFPRKGKWKIFWRQLINQLGLWAALFLFTFGYAYLDQGFASRSSLPLPPKEIDLIGKYFEIVDDCMKARQSIPGLDSTIAIVNLANQVPDIIVDQGVRNVLQHAGYPANWKTIIRNIRPEGSLRRLSISGIYNPFTGEANVDPALPNISLLFVKAHELAHSYGISSEAEANFVAYLACVQSGEPLMIYAGEYAIWRQIAQEINRTQDEQTLIAIRERIPEVLILDRIHIRASYFKHQPYFPELSETMNDSYLKLQGISAGTNDYDRFLQLYLAWEISESR